MREVVWDPVAGAARVCVVSSGRSRQARPCLLEASLTLSSGLAPADAANDVYASLLVLRAIQSHGGISADDDTVALRSLSTTPYDPWSGFVPSRPAVTTSAGTTTRALPPLPVAAGEQTPQHVLTARKYEAFTLFHDERLPLSEITARMSIKPLSVVWNVLSAAAKLRERGVVVEWDVERLVGFVDEVSGEGRGVAMLREHGELLGELKRGTALAL